ncbi:MAG: nickel-dependent hydrogenase large subunit, partial [Ignavibacteriales bacterium]|nr:nickel-dependent hydrogenase large subunit [Ignavibacteriales bacterium]
VAYQMSSTQAMERILEIQISPEISRLRRLLYCSEWIESHALHIYLLHAPDFLGFEDSLQLARQNPEVVKKGLRLKKIGNDLMSAIGGREIHPINVRVGGFYKAPSTDDLRPFVEKLEWAVEAAEETVRWAGTLTFPDFERDYLFVSLRNGGEYPMNEGRIMASDGMDIAVDEYERFFTEEHVEHSNALHSIRNGHGAYLVGPLARYALNFDTLTPKAQAAAQNAGLERQCRNPFKSIIVRSVELLYACEEALRIVRSYAPPRPSFVSAPVKEGTGYGCTEAPRGMLFHRYTIDEKGLIRSVKIVPPTSQNQKTIEADLHEYVSRFLDKPKNQLTWECEQSIRNYDPCISCATHFLKLEIVQSG